MPEDFYYQKKKGNSSYRKVYSVGVQNNPIDSKNSLDSFINPKKTTKKVEEIEEFPFSLEND